jgi:hypothetical protein
MRAPAFVLTHGAIRHKAVPLFPLSPAHVHGDALAQGVPVIRRHILIRMVKGHRLALERSHGLGAKKILRAPFHPHNPILVAGKPRFPGGVFKNADAGNGRVPAQQVPFWGFGEMLGDLTGVIVAHGEKIAAWEKENTRKNFRVFQVRGARGEKTAWSGSPQSLCIVFIFPYKCLPI